MVTVRYDHVMHDYNLGRYANNTGYVLPGNNLTVASYTRAVYYDSTKYVSPTVYAEYMMKSVTAGTNNTTACVAACANNYAAGGGSVASGSATTSSSATAAWYRSSAVTISTGTYCVNVKNATASTTVVIYAARLAIVDEIGSSAPSKTCTKLHLATTMTPDSRNASSYAQPNCSAKFHWDADRYDGTVNVYFYAVMSSNNASYAAYAELYCTETSTVVTNSECSTTYVGTGSGAYQGATISSGSALTLASLDKRTFYIMIKSTSTGTAYIHAAWVEIVQSGTITKTRFYLQLGGSPTGNATTAYTTTNRTNPGFKYESDDWGISPSWYISYTMYVSSASYVGFSALTQYTTTTAESNTEEGSISLSGSTQEYLESATAAISLTDGNSYVTNWKSSNASGTCYCKSANLFFDKSWGTAGNKTRCDFFLHDVPDGDLVGSGGGGSLSFALPYLSGLASSFVVYYESGKFVKPKVYLEVLGNALDATSNHTEFILKDISTGVVASTTGTEIQGSRLHFDSTTPTWKRSRDINLVNGNNYCINMKNETTASSSYVIYQARLVIIDDIGSGTPSKTLNVFHMYSSGAAFDISSTSYTVPENGSERSARFYFDSSKTTGTVTAYLEAFMGCNGGGTVYADLYNITDGTEVSSSEISTTAIGSANRCRSSGLTLTTGKEYTIRFKVSSGATAYGYGGRLLVEQTGTITKTRYFFPVAGYIGGTSSTSYTTSYYSPGFKYENDDWWTTPTWYVDYTIKSAGGATATGAITLKASVTLLSNSEATSTSSSYTRVTTASSVSPADAIEYMVNRKTSSGSYTIYVLGAHLYFDYTWVAGGRSYVVIVM